MAASNIHLIQMADTTIASRNRDVPKLAVHGVLDYTTKGQSSRNPKTWGNRIGAL